MNGYHQSENGHPTAPKSLFLATAAFAIAFANWGLIAGLAPLLKKELGLSVAQSSLMIAIPVLLGALGRIPAGILTDRFGARRVFSLLLGFGILPTVALAVNHSYTSLLFWGFFLGILGSSFAIGVAFVSRWYPPQRQGIACGIYGAGNIGQSIAVFGGPVLGSWIGIPATFLIFGIASLTWGIVFAISAQNPPVKVRPKTFAECLSVLQTEKLTWALSLFYGLTFGGFVALSIYLPTLLQEMFALTPADAGARTAFFVILATLCRPVGGWLSDRIGGQILLLYVFLGMFAIGWLMSFPFIVPFTVGALGCSILFGLGNGGVFKLVPQYFPQQVGTVTGLVGAAGGLGGFFPPLELGMFRELTQSYAPGFILLSIFGLLCAWVLGRTFLRLPTPVQH
ncbi:MAG TPA: MFS transporter [Cyanobacteria bacterium UBA11369]|nr:MFS transporter [Cyanobacteria bacterium UBA11371]HBE32178.1 MFS transporter [Cyanobacteria bacterium UBA11368]HBE49319.1 MFS transporter [Cyanobacteria bacterium UBA11369]